MTRILWQGIVRAGEEFRLSEDAKINTIAQV